jgi:hypothetical protein
LENLNSLSIKSSELDEIEPRFFDNFPALVNFYASNNTCINATLKLPRLIDFERNPVLNECSANWNIPRDLTTPSGSEKLNKNINLITSIGLILFLVKWY